jgi:SAM-dependent methyltransferase
MPGSRTPAEGKPPEPILGLLPGGRSGTGPGLDFDRALGADPLPPLEHRDACFDLIWSLSAFTRIADGWAEWLLEARRLLSGRGVLVIGLAESAAFEGLTGIGWDDSRIGMTVLSPLNGAGSRIVFHSAWWVRAHWGRAFDLVGLEERDGRRFAVLRTREGAVSSADLERPEPGEDRELAAARANAEFLRSQLEDSEQRHRHQLEEQREDMNRELMRRSFAAADQEWARRGPGSPATLVAAEYEATTSWRLTKPLRAVGRMLRRAP